MAQRHILLCAFLTCACSDAALEPVPPPPPPISDNLVDIVGEVCTEPADITPFPVKILFVLDQSTSLQCTDSFNRRFDAINNVVDDLMPLPNAEFGFIGFASWSRQQTFTRERSRFDQFLRGQDEGPATDYQGSLATTLRLLEQDMLDSGPAKRARTRYVVIFVSDGIPVPRCNPGCEDDRTACTDSRDNDGDGLIDLEDEDCEDYDNSATHPDNIYGVCNTTREVPDDVYVDYAGRCPAYNQPNQIMQRVDEIKLLQRIYSVGELIMHTVFISSPEEVILDVCTDQAPALLGSDFEQARALMSEMAETGGGVFRDINLSEGEANFLDFDFNSLRTPYQATEFVAYNLHTQIGLDGPIADSDADGLTDEQEYRIGTDPSSRDTDGDDYRDLFEFLNQRSGFDPNDANLPALSCAAIGGVTGPSDSDGDGLLDCEEVFLRTEPRLADSDSDRMIDGFELRIGTDPTVADADRDPDFDGQANRIEAQANTNPNIADPERFLLNRVRYRLSDQGELDIPNRDTGELEARRCYEFEVSGLELAVTSQSQDRGRNRILLQVTGEPLGLSGSQGAIRQACVEVKYPGPGVKRPANGYVDLSASAFSALRAEMDGNLAAIGTCMDKSIVSRPDLDWLIDECLPIRQQVGRVLFDREALKTLLRQYFDRGAPDEEPAELKLPTVASDIFWPIEITNDQDVERDTPESRRDNHCFRAWEIDRIRNLMTILNEECQSCEALEALRNMAPSEPIDEAAEATE